MWLGQASGMLTNLSQVEGWKACVHFLLSHLDPRYHYENMLDDPARGRGRHMEESWVVSEKAT